MVTPALKGTRAQSDAELVRSWRESATGRSFPPCPHTTPQPIAGPVPRGCGRSSSASGAAYEENGLDDLTQINGNREQLEGEIQARYGTAKDQVKEGRRYLEIIPRRNPR